jgi:hypothetical protein
LRKKPLCRIALGYSYSGFAISYLEIFWIIPDTSKLEKDALNRTQASIAQPGTAKSISSFILLGLIIGMGLYGML